MEVNDSYHYTTQKVALYLVIFMGILYLSLYFSTEVRWWVIGLIISPLLAFECFILGVTYEINNQFFTKRRFNYLVYQCDYKDLQLLNIKGYRFNVLVCENRYLIFLLGIEQVAKNRIKHYVYQIMPNNITALADKNGKQLWRFIWYLLFVISGITIGTYTLIKHFSPPNYADLIPISGNIVNIAVTTKSSVQIDLAQQPFSFIYTKRAGEMALVRDSLINTDNEVVTLLVDPKGEYSIGQSERSHILIWGIQIDGVVLRDYKDIKQAWQRKDHLFGPLLVVFIMLFYGGWQILFCIIRIAKE